MEWVQVINCSGWHGCRLYRLAGEEMDLMEEVLKSADFSGETDLKDRLRAQLFDENDIPSLKKDDLTGGKNNGKQNSFARELSLDELDFVTAAGDAHYQRKKSSVEDVLNPLKKPFEDRI